MRFLSICAAALLLAGCANSPNSAAKISFGGFGGAPARPKTVVVTDFLLASDVAVIDRGFSTRQESKGGNFPLLERRSRTAARVNDEIVATIVASLHEAGLNAQPGSQESIGLGDNALVVAGRLRLNDRAKPVSLDRLGFGPGRGGVVADMTVKRPSSYGDPLLTFVADAPSNRKPVAGAAATARNEAIAAALAAENAAPEKLSPDVEAQARRLGLAVAEKILVHAKEQGWLDQPEAAEAQPQPQPEQQVRVKLPVPKPEQKPAA